MYLLGDTITAWLHFVLIFAIVGSLTAELVLCRHPLTKAVIARLARFDMVYGLSALGLLLVGFGRATGFAKGWSYYAQEPWFWVKIALFATVGGLSILPTMKFLRWNKTAKDLAEISIDAAEVQRIRRHIHAELGLLPFIALAATLMARGL